MSIWDWLGFGGGSRDERRPGVAPDAVRKIVGELDDLDPERARFVAAFAYVLSRVARADLEIDEDETREMERVVAARGGLPEAQAVIVVQMAKSHNRLFGGTENYVVTRELERIATHEQKLGLLGCLFAVSAADGSITTAEDNVIRQVADELKLSHRDYIDVRAGFRDKLAVLRPNPGEETP